MSHCWKCGEPVTAGCAECEYGCGASLVREPLLPESLECFNALDCEIDWNTIKTFEDLIKVLFVIHEGEGVFSDSPYHHALKKYLRPPDTPESL